MVHSLANEIILMDAAAEATYAAKIAERDTILLKAKEEALKLTQRAARERDTSREEAVASNTKRMQTHKEKTLAQAHSDAEALTADAQTRQDAAVTALIDAVCRGSS